MEEDTKHFVEVKLVGEKAVRYEFDNVYNAREFSGAAFTIEGVEQVNVKFGGLYVEVKNDL